jgi:hypothetical protein
MKLILLCAAVLALGFTSVRDSQPAKWRFIGDKTVAYGADHDVLHVNNVNDYFTKIKLRVTDAPLKIIDVKVHFENGDVQDVPVRSEINQGGETRVIDLTGGARRLKKLEFWYSTIGTEKGKSRVAVWGRR